MENRATGVSALVKVLGLPQHTGVWITRPSFAMHLGPNGVRCQDELVQHGCRENAFTQEKKI